MPFRAVRISLSISKVKYPTALTRAIFRWALIQGRLPLVRERQISSSAYQTPLRLLRSRGQRGARQS
jgi:hypothetical protein